MTGIVGQRPLVYRIGKDEIPLWPEERAMLRDFATLGSYPTAYTQVMQDLKVAGVFSRLEECGPNGTAVVTDFGRELFKRIGTPLASGTLTEGGDAKQAPGESLSGPVAKPDAQGSAHD